MKVNLSIVETLTGFALPPINEVVARVNARLGGVEAVINLGEKYKDARVVRIVACEKHPDADKLSVCLVDDGGVVPDVARDEQGLVQVVCGAPNARADMWAVWLPPKATVPTTYGDAEPFVLDARKLRGVLSQGMLAAGDELDINDDHDGIIELTERDLPQGAALQPGASFAELFGLTGYTLEIENKMFTHRPDCFGQIGVAREIAGIFGKQFTSPEWYKVAQRFADGDGSLPLTVVSDAPGMAPRFMAVALAGVQNGPSPLWLQCQLVAMGGKSINYVVDATNYMMLMTAQPTHAYDYDKVRDNTLTVRAARDGETLALLNGKTITLTKDDMVIADAERTIGLAGIMGGSETEVSADTTRVILECANFDMYAVRKTAMRHGVFTDALARFNKGQSPLQTAPVLHKLMEMIGGQQASAVCDEKVFVDAHDEYFQGRYLPANIDISSQFICERLGGELSTDEICQLLRQVEIDNHSLEEELGYICLTVPFWRTDLTIAEDIVEEVGRLYGFDRLPRELPRRSARPAPKNMRRETKQRVRESLRQAGANEVLTYSFVHEQVLTKAKQNPADAFKLSNALSPDLQYYRLTVLPSLLDKVRMNIKAGHDTFALFEMGKGHCKAHATDDDGLPSESNFIDMVYTAKKPQAGAPFYRARRMVAQLAADLGFEIMFAPIRDELAMPVAAPFDQARSALVMATDGCILGMVGELQPAVIKQFKLPAYTAAATLDMAGVEVMHAQRQPHYQPLSRFPSITQDVSLIVARDAAYNDVHGALYDAVRAATDADVALSPVSIYQADGADEKTITLRIRFTSHDRTLTTDEVNQWVSAAVAQVCQAVGARVE